MATATEISERALRRLGLVQSGHSASASDIADAKEALNAMIAAWETDWLSGDVLPLDARFEAAVIAMLAVRLAEDYGVVPGAILLRDAEQGEGQIQASFFVVPTSTFDRALKSSNGNAVFDFESSGLYRGLWMANTDYPVRVIVTNNANQYECTTPGVSGATGGPTGTLSSITDGTCVWCWRGVTA